MIFRKRKKMVDVRELQRRGVVSLPKKDIVIPTDKNGFVELGANAHPTSTPSTETPSASSVMDFLGNSSATTNPSTPTSRQDSERITELDNKIYKLEQRIELLEKKLDINPTTNSNVGVMGW